MREKMTYNPGIYQLREATLKRMLAIIGQRKQSKPGGIVFFGDSITEYCDLKRFYQTDKELYNCGIAGANSDELMWFIDEAVIQYQPSIVFLMVGINDLGNTSMHSPRKIAQNIDTLAHLITENCSHTKLYIISPLPCIEELQDYHHVMGIRCNCFVKNVHVCLEELLTSKRTTLLNFYSLFDDGQVKKELYSDGLHLNNRGYEILSQQIKCYL